MVVSKSVVKHNITPASQLELGGCICILYHNLFTLLLLFAVGAAVTYFFPKVQIFYFIPNKRNNAMYTCATK